MWARAVLAAIGLLVGVMAAGADIEILGFRLPLLVKKAEIAVPRQVKASINETASDNNSGVAFYHFLGHKIIFRFEIQDVPTTAETAWNGINHTSALPFFSIFTGVQIVRQCLIQSPIGLFLSSRGKWIGERLKEKSWRPTGILVLQRYLNRLSNGRFYVERRILWADPRALRFHVSAGGDFCLFRHGDRLCFGRVSLIFNRLVDLDHFMNLPAHGPEGHGDQNYRDPFSKFLSAIFALFLFAIGNALFFYGIDKSREIGGWAVWIVFAGFPFILAASIFLFSGVLGWDGGLSAWGL